MNFRVWLERIADRHGSEPFLFFRDEIITFQDFNRRVNAMASALAGEGVRKGDNVVLLLPNHPVYLYAWFGLAKLGARAVLINTSLRGASLRHLLATSGAVLGLVDASFGTVIEEASTGTSLQHILWHSESRQARGRTLTDLVQRCESQEPPLIDVAGGDTMAMPHTSGTTGPAKLCLLSHNYYLALAEASRSVFELARNDVVYDPLPLFHINPHYAVLGALAAGCRLVLPERFSASRFWTEVAHYGVTVAILHLWPVGVLKKRGADPAAEAHRLRMAFPADREFMERFRIPSMTTLYGSTEAGGITTGLGFRLPLPNDLGLAEPLSSITGPSREDLEVGIVDENDDLLPSGQAGEIVVRPRRPHVIFDGYFNMPEKTIQSFRNLWFHTGDLGFLDEQRGLHFLGRAADSIRVRGEFVHIDELENLMRAHPSVADCAVVGVTAEIAEQEILAVVEVRDRKSIDPADLVAFLKGRIADYMIPRYYRFQTLPRVPGTGKVRKEQLGRNVQGDWDRVRWS